MTPLAAGIFLTLWVPVILQMTDGSDSSDSEENFWDLPESDRKCSAGMGTIGADPDCVPCPAGSYNNGNFRTDSCVSCPVGHFSSQDGSTECQNCDSLDLPFEATTLDTGNTSPEACVDTNEVIANFGVATIGVTIGLQGKNFCHEEMKKALLGMSHLRIFDAHFTQCLYDDELNQSTMKLEVTLPSRYAMDMWFGMKFAEVHYMEANAWVEVGDYYFRKIADHLLPLVQDEVDRWLAGLKIDPDLLSLSDMSIASFMADFQGHCAPGRVGSFCDEDTSEENSDMYVSLRYQQQADDDFDCSSNAGIAKLRSMVEAEDAVDYNKQELGCYDDCQAKMYFGGCEATDIIIIIIVMRGGDYNTNAADLTLSFNNDPSDEWKFEVLTNCEDSSFSDNFESCSACDSGSYRESSGLCKKCPFTTWGEDGVCKSCKVGFETPFWGMESDNACIQMRTNWRESSYTDHYLREPAGRVGFNLGIGGQMDMCGMAKEMNNLKDTCTQEYGEIKEVNWEDMSEERDIVTRTICFTAINMDDQHAEMCGDDFNLEWSDVLGQLFEGDFEGGINNLVCFLLSPLVKLNTSENQNADCANINDDEKILEVGIDLPEMPLDMETAGILVPLLTGAQNLVTMNFEDFADAGLAMMAEMGIEDMNLFTGWRLANSVKDMVMEMPRGMRVSRFAFDPSWENDDFYCDDTNESVKRQCEMYCSVKYEQYKCKRKDGSMPSSCNYDECDNCATTYWGMQNNERVPFECDKCEFGDNLPGSEGYLVWTSETGEEARYTCREGYAARNCDYSAKCDIMTSTSDIYYPECVSLDGKCDFPDTDADAHITKDESYEMKYGTECPSSKYICEDGFFPKYGDLYAKCIWHMENWHMKLPTCVEACEFPDDIENGNLVKVYQTEDGIYADYQCDAGFFLQYDQQGRCNFEEGKGSTAVTPNCVAADTCEFPESYNGATKADEGMNSGSKWARYECPYGMEMMGNTYAGCAEGGSEPWISILCYNGPSCEYNEPIDGGWIEWQDNRPRVKCWDNRVVEGGDPWVYCERGEATYPMCVEMEDSCELPDSNTEGLWRMEKYHNSARYECNKEDGWKLPEMLVNTGGWVSCEGEMVSPVSPYCEDFECEFKNEIENGEFESSERNKAWYNCKEDFRFEKTNEAICYEGGQIEYPRCIEAGNSCDFTKIPQDMAKIVEETKYSVRIECEEGYMFKEDHHDGWVYCDENSNLSEIPMCVKKCEFWPEIVNGYKVEEFDDRARYECNGNYRIEGSDWVYCDKNTASVKEWKYPTCVMDNNDGDTAECYFPEHINHGAMWKSEDDWALYYCYPPFVVLYNRPLLWANVQYENLSREEAYRRLVGVGWCDRETGEMPMPECAMFSEVSHCGLPNHIEGGEATLFHDVPEEGGEYDLIKPTKAEYKCHDGYHMVETMYGNVGWCREDGSMEIPRCEEKQDTMEVVFRLYMGNNNWFTKGQKSTKSKKGIVVAREFGMDEDRNVKDGWEIGCTDGFNDNAAGTVCRSFGFAGGERMAVKEKMLDDEFKENMQFGWTKFQCKYDDTLVMSEHCHAEKYSEYTEKHGASAMCFNSQVMAVQCYPKEKYHGFHLKAVITKKMLVCEAQMYKKGSIIDLGSAGWSAKLYVDGNEMDQDDIKYKKKIGFTFDVEKGSVAKSSCFKCCIFDEDNNMIEETKSAKCNDEE